MQGWKTSEVQVAAGSIFWLGKALVNPHLYPITHVACAVSMAWLAHSVLRSRTNLKLADAGADAPPSLLSHLWAWFRGKPVAKPTQPPKGPDHGCS